MNIDFLNKITRQVEECRKRYGNYAGRHEAWGVLSEENHELFMEICKKKPDFERLESEIIDNICVLVKTYEDIVLKRNDR